MNTQWIEVFEYVAIVTVFIAGMIPLVGGVLFEIKEAKAFKA